MNVIFSRRGLLGPLLAVATGAALLAGCSSAPPSSSTPPSSPSTPVSTPAPTTSAPPTTSHAPSSTHAVGAPVHVSLNLGDGATVGVGMPIIATFPVKITDGRAFQKATVVKVNNVVADAAWYFEASDPASGHVMEAHLRLDKYWPANSTIDVDLPVEGLSAGTGLVFDDSLTLSINTGDAHVLTVSNATHTLTVRDNGVVWGTFPVSLGASNSQTLRGTKVVMEKLAKVDMSGTEPNGSHYNVKGVPFAERLTYGGEYLHAASWNTYNIDHGINSSNGCTNLHPTDAEKLYNFLGVGDPVEYPDAEGAPMQLGLGYGDWNVTWSAWQTGGAVKTH